MSIVLNDSKISIIDRTLMAIVKKEFKKGELVEFFNNLKNLGVDLFEINEEVLNGTKDILLVEDFIFRVEKAEHLEICNKYKFEHIIIREEDTEILEEVKNNVDKVFKILLEIHYDHFKDYEDLNKIKEIINKNSIYSIRINGIDNCFFDDFTQEFGNTKLNVCANDRLHMATAVGFQAALKGVNSITTAFCGKDSIHGTSALEEVLVALKVIKGAEVKGETSILALMREQYEKLTYKQLLWNKPIIGKNIFKYESGVHAMGIKKNPETYEPFLPELVGQKRRLAIGKHSSKNSIYLKLNEFGDKFNFNELEVDIILMEVKRISVLKKMEISDEDFIDICTRIEACRHV